MSSHRTVDAELLASCSRYRLVTFEQSPSKLHLNGAVNSMCEGEFNMGDERNQGQSGQGQGSQGEGQQGQDKQRQQQENTPRRQDTDVETDQQQRRGPDGNRNEQEPERKRA
jgi:hypothetical protein